jgi:hypothetical protein
VPIDISQNSQPIIFPFSFVILILEISIFNFLYLAYQIKPRLQGLLARLPVGRTDLAAVFAHELGRLELA